jgi:hypothetical protein
MAALRRGVVTDSPETHYTRSADGTNLAYQVSGDGPLDLVFVHGPHPIDLLSEDPGFIRFRRGRIRILDRPGLESTSCDCYRVLSEVFDRLL